VSTEVKKEIELEIAYVLFIDIVGYSKLLIDQQRRLLELLNEIVRGTEQFRKAEASHRLITIPTGDGMALVFYNAPEAPVECALEISRAAREHSELKLRMGVHSGPVSGVVNVSGRANIAGAGINIAQRVMDCGDAEHILLSKHVAEDLEQLGHWNRRLHDLGECEVKHGAHVSVVNLYTEELGNPEVPQKFLQARHKTAAAVPVAAEKPRISRSWIIAVAVIIVAALALGGYFLSRRSAPAAAATARSQAPVASPAAVSSAAPVVATMPEKSIAVLPFENLSDEKQNAFFTDGVQDEILTDLARIADLKVISRTSVMQYKTGAQRNLREIGQQLGVAHLVEGSVQRVSNRVRVNAQLIDARNDAHLWAQTYDRDLADVFAIQSEIAKAIADQLQAKLSPQEQSAIERQPTSDVIAFDLYSRAVSLISSIGFSAVDRASLSRAIGLLNQAIARDQSFFEAYCQLARAHDELYSISGDHTPARLALAEAAVEAAFRLRSDAGEAHLARAEHLYRGYRDYDGAWAELQIARRSLPNDPRVFELPGYILRRRGKQEEALHLMQRAIELDPRNFFTLQQIALSYSLLRNYKEEAAILDRALGIKPDDAGTKAVKALVYFDSKADTRPLHETLASIHTKDPSAMQGVADTWFNCALAEQDLAAAREALAALGDSNFGMDISQFAEFRGSFGQALIARMAKEETKAREAFAAARVEQQKSVDKQPNYGPPLSVLGLIDAALGEKQKALEEGRRAVELLPVKKDAVAGAAVIEYLAVIAAWVGEKDLAFEQLERAVRMPNTLSSGQLKLLPYWDPLRVDPRFDQIVASLAPKE
jgi:TolB-like protein/class 3 adenylate cyclase